MKTLVLAFFVLACVVLLASGNPYEDRQYLGGHSVRLSYDNRGNGKGYGRGYGGDGYGRGYGGGYGRGHGGGYGGGFGSGYGGGHGGGYGGYDKY